MPQCFSFLLLLYTSRTTKEFQFLCKCLLWSIRQYSFCNFNNFGPLRKCLIYLVAVFLTILHESFFDWGLDCLDSFTFFLSFRLHPPWSTFMKVTPVLKFWDKNTCVTDHHSYFCCSILKCLPQAFSVNYSTASTLILPED